MLEQLFCHVWDLVQFNQFFLSIDWILCIYSIDLVWLLGCVSHSVCAVIFQLIVLLLRERFEVMTRIMMMMMMTA